MILPDFNFLNIVASGIVSATISIPSLVYARLALLKSDEATPDGGQKPPETGEKVSKSRGTSWKSHYLKTNDPLANLNAGFSDHP